MRKTTISIALAFLANFVLLSVVHNQIPPKGQSGSTGPTPDLNCLLFRCRPAFARSWDGVHQFAQGDGNIGMPNPTTGVPCAIADLSRPGAATLDFVWGGDNYANCWAGDASCWSGEQDPCSKLPLPANPQHPIVGHYVPFFGIRMLDGYARCFDDSDCDSVFPEKAANDAGMVNREYLCQPLPDKRVDTFQARLTDRINVYTDAAGNREKVCVKRGPDPTPALTAEQAKAVEFRYWRRAHPSWLLYSSKRDTKDGVSWFGGGPPLDVSNPAVAKEVLGRMDFGRIKGWAHLRDYYGAISLDSVFLTNQGQVQYRCMTRGTAGRGPCIWASPYSGRVNGDNRYRPRKCAAGAPEKCANGGYCDLAWTKIVLNWVKQVRDKAHSMGLNLVINVGYGGHESECPYTYIPATDLKLLELFDKVDGVLDEGGFTAGYGRGEDQGGCYALWSYDGRYTCGANAAFQKRWSNFSGYLRAVQSRGKPYFSKNMAPGPLPDPDHPDPDPHLDAQAIQWALASFLLSRDTSPSHALQAIFMEQNNYDIGYDPYGALLSKALNPTTIGYPCPELEPVPHSPQPNVFTRQFSGGFVIVNANQPGGPAATISLPMRDNVKWPAATPKSLAAESGAIILLERGRLCN